MRSGAWGEQGAFFTLAAIGTIGIGFILLATRGLKGLTQTTDNA
jgi:hypothetical protein